MMIFAQRILYNIAFILRVPSSDEEKMERISSYLDEEFDVIGTDVKIISKEDSRDITITPGCIGNMGKIEITEAFYLEA